MNYWILSNKETCAVVPLPSPVPSDSSNLIHKVIRLKKWKIPSSIHTAFCRSTSSRRSCRIEHVEKKEAHNLIRQLLNFSTSQHIETVASTTASIGKGDCPKDCGLWKTSMTIGDLKTRLLSKLGRRRHSTSSTTASLSSAASVGFGEDKQTDQIRRNLRSSTSRGSQRAISSTSGSATIDEKDSSGVDSGAIDRHGGRLDQTEGSSDRPPQSILLEPHLEEHKHNITSTADFPTPNLDTAPVFEEEENEGLRAAKEIDFQVQSPSPETTDPQTHRPSELSRRQSLLPHRQTSLIKSLLETELPQDSRSASVDCFTTHGPLTTSANMVNRKLWVKRPNASATQVIIHEDDLVDDVRDMILKKYANSLGRSFDAPDVTLRIVPRDRVERTLGPDEHMARILDEHFPGGQTVNDALVIDVPLRRTPKPSPQPNRSYYTDDDRRPTEAGSDYFPPMPATDSRVVPSPRLPLALPNLNGISNHHSPLTSHSMSVLTTGHVPSLPSPGSVRRHHRERPRIGRQHTSSPTVINGQSQLTHEQHGTVFGL